MIARQFFYVQLLLKRLLILLGLFFLCRVLFFLFNFELFPYLDGWELLMALLYGLRFDIAAILIINVVFILMHIIPNPWRERPWYRQLLRIQFYVVNGIFIILESADFIYYKFSQERTSSHILGLRSDIVNMIPQFILDFWYILLLGMVLFWGIDWLYSKTYKKSGPLKNITHYPIQSGIALIIMALMIVGIRGGLQSEPLAPANATQVVQPGATGLVTNTTFTFLHSLLHRELKPVQYMPESEAAKLAPFHQTVGALPISRQPKPNVVVIILESFSQEYIGYYNNGRTYTPHLDTLLSNSLVFKHAFANGKHSIDIAPTVTMGLPALMTSSFIASPYSRHPFTGVGSYLDSVGYHSYFFHGGNNGTMGLDSFCMKAGFDSYFGRKEFGNDQYYDGNWGIFDGPFFRYMADRLDTLPKPFVSYIFSLSSHHPFTLPPAYRHAFDSIVSPMLRSVMYTDAMVGQFFDYARQKKWFNNTVFLITADHTGPIFDDRYKNRLGHFKVPVAIYDPRGRWQGVDTHQVVQQADIFPTVLSLAGYEGEVTGFGQTLLDSVHPNWAVNYLSGVYQLITRDFVIQYDGKQVVGLYYWKNDNLLRNNLVNAVPHSQRALKRKLQAILQQYNHALVYQKLQPL